MTTNPRTHSRCAFCTDAASVLRLDQHTKILIPCSPAKFRNVKVLTGDAYELFNKLTEDGDGEIGFTTFPGALDFFLRTYAQNKYLEAAVERIDNITQSKTETPRQFYRRLMDEARDLNGALSQHELMTKFPRGLNRSVREILQECFHEFQDQML